MSGRKRPRPSASAAAAASRAKTETELEDVGPLLSQLAAAERMLLIVDDLQKDYYRQLIGRLRNRLTALDPQLQAERLQRLALNLAGVDETDEDSTSDEDSTPDEGSPPNKKSKGNNPRGSSVVLRL